MKPTLGKLFDDATRLTRGGKLAAATASIQRALRSAASRLDSGVGVALFDAPLRGPQPAGSSTPATRAVDPTVPSDPGAAAGSFETGTYTGASGTRSYRLFVPASVDATGPRRPLIVMLHGCTQSPEDFAAGTRMNEIATEHRMLVLYPEQAARSNSSKCWNWFMPGDQRRGAGEPELLAGMTRHILAARPVDPLRVYVAGLSAGGAMADILGREYPDLYAAVGVHSGLPQGAARDIASAFAAMRNGASPAVSDAAVRTGGTPPAIVFHGDRDGTVHPANGEQVIGAILEGVDDGAGELVASRATSAAAGRSVTHTVHRKRGVAPDAPSVAEHWLVHGTGHAWSGGHPSGSYTDAAGPDASREMVRFFLEHPRQPA